MTSKVHPVRHPRRAAVVTALLVIGLLSCIAPVRRVRAGGTPARKEDVQQQLDELRNMIRQQNAVIEDLRRQLGAKEGVAPGAPVAAPAVEPSPRTTVPMAVRKPEASGVEGTPAVSTTTGPFQVGYDKGFVIQPVDRDKTPFRLRVTGRMQLRETVFSRDDKQWTDNAGETRRIRNRNDFEIERGRLTFDGYALDPKLGYYINFDFDTDDEHDVIIHDFYMYYLFSDAFILHGGKAFVPGSRDWLSGSTKTRFADRSLATSFFRPDRSVGLWAIGEPVDDVYYRTMLANGFNTTDLTFEDVDTNFAYATSVWWDVLGNYGDGYSDLEWHERPGVQVGTSFTYARQQGDEGEGQPLAEENFVRLSDGTRLTDTGALAADVTVDRFDVYLYAVDLAAKWAGFSVNGEYFFRWIEDLHGDGSLPIDGFFDHGFYLEAGYFVIPKYVEVNARMAQVYGRFGDRGAEYAGGVNWFINGTHNWKIAFDGTRVFHSPAQNSAPGYRAGDDGVLIRTQLQVGF